MPLQATSGAASYDGFGGGVPFVPTYIEEVFSTYLYTGNSSTQTITNGIDLAGKGGLVWAKDRTFANSHQLYDTARGVQKRLMTDQTAAQGTETTGITAFNSNGWTMGAQYEINDSASNYVSWTFRKQPKFFDVVTYTGNGVAGRTIAHNLGSTPGCIIVKRTDTTAGWPVYHRGIGATQAVELQGTFAAFSTSSYWNDTAPTSTVFTVGFDSWVNANGGTYVAYLFAHNAGGFGSTNTDNVISCGSFTVNGSGDCSVSLGYEPQWLMVKSSTAIDNWYLYDNMRGFPVAPSDGELLRPNTSQAGITASTFRPTSTGFVGSPGTGFGTGIYIAIRRGPMKTPTSGTSVFNPVARAGTGAATTQNTSLNAPDLAFTIPRDAAGNSWSWIDRLRGQFSLASNNTNQEFDTAPNARYFSGQTSYQYDGNGQNQSGTNYILEVFKRAPGFFDVACFTTDGTTNQRVSHNLTVAPEFIITKRRDAGGGWFTYSATLGRSGYVSVNSTAANNSGFSDVWGTSDPTATDFGYNCQIFTNSPYTGRTIVAYLFATVAGVSKCGSYTGTGALQTINCGFTSGARFVLIKRTDSTGDWWVYDSARGITSGNDPYLLLNSTAAEVTSTNYVDTDTTGFKVTAAAPAGLNASGGTYIFLAIA